MFLHGEHSENDLRPAWMAGAALVILRIARVMVQHKIVMGVAYH